MCSSINFVIVFTHCHTLEVLGYLYMACVDLIFRANLYCWIVKYIELIGSSTLFMIRTWSEFEYHTWVIHYCHLASEIQTWI